MASKETRTATELAKELGMESKALLEWLKNNGEFVKSASSTIDRPTIRKVREAFPSQADAAQAQAATAGLHSLTVALDEGATASDGFVLRIARETGATRAQVRAALAEGPVVVCQSANLVRLRELASRLGSQGASATVRAVHPSEPRSLMQLAAAAISGQSSQDRKASLSASNAARVAGPWLAARCAGVPVPHLLRWLEGSSAPDAQQARRLAELEVLLEILPALGLADYVQDWLVAESEQLNGLPPIDALSKFGVTYLVVVLEEAAYGAFA